MNQVLKTIIIFVVVLSLLSLIAYIVITNFFGGSNGPCEDVMHYRIGSVDERFDISHDEVVRIAQEAENPWESARGHQLFQYDPEASFAINFIYDERQRRFDASEMAMEDITTDKEEISNRSDSLDEREDKYDKELQLYEDMLDAYERDIENYNTTVNNWNERGGAPEDVFKELEVTQKDLAVKSSQLSKQADRVNTLATELNAESSAIGEAANEINTSVQSYNSLYGTERAFDQGTFTEKEINVFQFAQEEDLTLVLVHEFGHALGIDHVEDPKAIMYPMLGDQNIELITLQHDDIAALLEVCSSQ